MFPEIKTIDDMLPAIEGKKEIIVAERPHFNIIQYIVQTPTLFPPIQSKNDSLLRECRGITFDKEGNILSRPFHKFFNVGEREETLPSNIDLSNSHVVLDKLDGSMIRPLFIKEFNGFRLATKMGISEVAMQAEVFVADNLKYFKFFRYCLERDVTPIFEWISPKNRIVVRYDNPYLVLLAVRENVSGKYFELEDLQKLSVDFEIPLVKSYDSIPDIVNFMNRSKREIGIEGYILRFANGQMFKIKTDEYLLQHRSKELVSIPRKVVELILDEKIDDILPSLVAEDRKAVNLISKMLTDEIESLVDELDKYWEQYGKMDRKTYALNYTLPLKPFFRKAIFSMMDGKTSIELVKQFLLSASKTESYFEQIKKEYKIMKGI